MAAKLLKSNKSDYYEKCVDRNLRAKVTLEGLAPTCGRHPQAEKDLEARLGLRVKLCDCGNYI
jgi:hypothetical protein